MPANFSQNINFGQDGINTALITVSSSVNAYGAFMVHCNDNKSIISVYSLSETTPGITAVINSGNTGLLVLTNTSSQILKVVITQLI